MEKCTTVIIADNAEEFCAGLSATLKHAEGFRVLGTATDGEQAIRMVREQKPDALVLDLIKSKKKEGEDGND